MRKAETQELEPSSVVSPQGTHEQQSWDLAHSAWGVGQGAPAGILTHVSDITMITFFFKGTQAYSEVDTFMANQLISFQSFSVHSS